MRFIMERIFFVCIKQNYQAHQTELSSASNIFFKYIKRIHHREKNRLSVSIKYMVCFIKTHSLFYRYTLSVLSLALLKTSFILLVCLLRCK